MNILDVGIYICQMMSFEEINNALDLITEFDAICDRVSVLYSVGDREFLFRRIPEQIETNNKFLV